MRKGISLVALIITIIVLIVLTAAVVLTGINTPQNAQLAVFYNNISTVQEAVNLKMLNNMSHYSTGDLDLEKCKWIGVVEGYTEANAQTNANPEFNDSTIKGINVSQIDDSIKSSLSMSEEEFNKYYINNKGTVYHEGFAYDGITYYNRTVTSESNVSEIPVIEETDMYVVLTEDGELVFSNNEDDLNEYITVNSKSIAEDGNYGNIKDFNFKSYNELWYVNPDTNEEELLIGEGEIVSLTPWSQVSLQMGAHIRATENAKSNDVLSAIFINEIVLEEGGFSLFYGCYNLQEIENINYLNVCNVTNMSCAFGRCDSLVSLDLSGWDTSNVTDMSAMFFGCTSLKSLNLSGRDTSNVTDMSSMFSVCSSLESLNLSGWDTSNVTDMQQMFNDCNSIVSLDINHFNTSNITNMEGMFDFCDSLESLDLSEWNMENVRDMSFMFYFCRALTDIDLSDWNTSNVTNMQGMFSSCKSLESLDLSGWNTSNVTNMQGMFWSCELLESLDLSGWNTSNVTDMSRMFWSCDSLESLDISGWNTNNVIDMEDMFYKVPGSAEIIIGPNWNPDMTPGATSYSGVFTQVN